MPDRTADRRSNRGFHAVLVVLGAGLGIAAVCLIVFGTTSPKQLLVGIILGLWAALLAAFGLPGMRRAAPEQGLGTQELEALQAELTALADTTLKATQDGLKATQDSITSQGQDFRRMSELQSARETAARREAELSLQLAIRHEIERTVADQVGSLREEVSSLRAEVVDRLDGQIKLERIEITRVIGSDLEALQNEVRRLAAQRESVDLDKRLPTQDFTAQPVAGPIVTGHAPAGPAVARESSEIVDAELIEASPSPAKPAPANPAQPNPAQPSPVQAPARPSPVQASPVSGSLAEPGPFSQVWGPVRSVRANAPESTPAPYDPPPYDPSALPPAAFTPAAFTPEPFTPEPLTPEPPAPLPTPGPPAPAPPEPLPPSPLPPSPLPPSPLPPSPLPPEPFAPQPFGPVPPAPRPVPEPEPLPPLEPPPPSTIAASYPRGGDIFADLPRLTPISPDLLGLSGKRRAPEDDPSSPKYVGRRRPDASSGTEPHGWDEIATPRTVQPEPPAVQPEPPGPGPRGTGRRRAPGHASE